MKKLSKDDALQIVSKYRPGVKWKDPEPVCDGGWITAEDSPVRNLGEPSLYVDPDGQVIELIGPPTEWPKAVTYDMRDDELKL